jgi:hypothetical protein
VGRYDYTDVIGRVESGTKIEQNPRSGYADAGSADNAWAIICRRHEEHGVRVNNKIPPTLKRGLR